MFLYFYPNHSASNQLHHEFPMIKYARGGRSIPHERVFKLDNDNLVGNRMSVIGDELIKTLGTFIIISTECINFLYKFVP